MKRLFIIISLLAFTTVANAQFLVSANIGGYYSNGSSTADATFLGFTPTMTDTSYTIPTVFDTMDNMLNVTGGFKFGYQFGRLQIGISARISWSRANGGQTPDEFFVNNPSQYQYDVYAHYPEHDNPQGWFVQQQISYSIAPYARYELINFGDVAFFAELSGYFTKVNKPLRHDYVEWSNLEMHSTIDTTYNIEQDGHSFGASIIPGLSWQLSPHCYIDLYLDVLALTFDKTNLTTVTVKDEFDYTATPRVLARRTTTTYTTSSTDLGFGITGSPLLTNRNWVRVGFNYTF